jgi:hypothetical protein
VKTFFALLNVASRDMFRQDSDEWAGRLIPYGATVGCSESVKRLNDAGQCIVSQRSEHRPADGRRMGGTVGRSGGRRAGIEGKKRGVTAK